MESSGQVPLNIDAIALKSVCVCVLVDHFYVEQQQQELIYVHRQTQIYRFSAIDSIW